MKQYWFDIVWNILGAVCVFLVILFILARFRLRFFKRKTDELNLELKKLYDDLKIANEDLTEAYKHEKRLAEELNMITYVGSAITSTLDIDELFKLITRTAVEIMSAEVCTLRLLDKENQELVLKSVYGLSESYIFKGNVKIGKSIVGRVVKNKVPFVVLNLQENSRYEYPELAEKSGLKSLLSIPLTIKDEVLGALSVYTKEERHFGEVDIKVLSAFTSQVAVAIENARLFTSIKEMYFSTVKAFATALSARDLYTHGHSEAVAKYAKAIAEEINLTEKEIELVEFGAILHDIGKIGIEDKILNKPASLSTEEYEKVKRHPVIASEILGPLNWFSELLPIITHHHEHFDGGGYPAGLSRDGIPLLARILLVVDAFEAMTSDRPYRKALTYEQAIAELQKNTGTQFDPKIVEAFLRVLSKR